jgi:hypothetical protein
MAGESLPTSGTHYALVKVRGKPIKSRLRTDLPEARRTLKRFRNDLDKVDPGSRKMSVEELADRYLATMQHQASGTVRKKRMRG